MFEGTLKFGWKGKPKAPSNRRHAARYLEDDFLFCTAHGPFRLLAQEGFVDSTLCLNNGPNTFERGHGLLPETIFAASPRNEPPTVIPLWG